MSDWSRKHLCDLVSVCKRSEADPTLTIAHQKAFAGAYAHAKQFECFPNAGGTHNLVAIVTMVCAACRSTSRHQCSGRSHWDSPCQLLHAAWEEGNRQL